MSYQAGIDLDTPIGRVYDALSKANAAMLAVMPLVRKEDNVELLVFVQEASEAIKRALWREDQLNPRP